ncbi:MAG: alpha/beta fold hydrolase [Gammaproteobacteria bacterium]|jgi:abhydrolase domain-containing protein 6|nr:alpha/beta fold hydrolase [Gammaproteobacteria bacterium]
MLFGFDITIILIAIGGLLLLGSSTALAIWYWATPVAWWFRFLERRHGRLKSAYIDVEAARTHLLYRHLRHDNDSIPVLLLHGLGADADHWCLMCASLSDDLQLIIPDLPGFGDSDMPRLQRQTPAAYAAWLVQLLDQMDIPRVHVVGNSMGGYIAAQLAHDYPDRIASLYLLAPGGITSGPLSDYLQQINDGLQNALVVTSLQQQREVASMCMQRRLWLPEPMHRWLARRSLRHSAHTQACFDAMRYAAEPLETLAASITQPALILWGACDRVLHPAGLQILAKLMPQAETVLLENTGHLPMLEAAKLCARRYQAFLEQLE